ncbi:MAG: hypothetical protein KBF50_10050 [Steroidobacteraceae bacterium]|jgi:hypothetical protein|nr:hypothetical protein [Pseudomonadota bacterium]MBP9130609.1 hypothetical protein [Steroidobacteraceae bacterium]
MAGFMVFGFVLIYLRDFAPGKEQWIAEYAVGKHFESRLALAGMLMPVGILAEVLPGAPLLFVLIGGISMVVAIAWFGVAVARMKSWPDQDENAKL